MNQSPNARDIREQQEETDSFAERLFSEGRLDDSALRIDILDVDTPFAASVATFRAALDIGSERVDCWVRGSLERPLFELTEFEPGPMASVAVGRSGDFRRVSDPVAVNLFSGLVQLHGRNQMPRSLELELSSAPDSHQSIPEPQELVPLHRFRLTDQWIREVRSVPPDFWEIGSREVSGSSSTYETVLRLRRDGEEGALVELIHCVERTPSEDSGARSSSYRLGLFGCRRSEFIKDQLTEADIEALFLAVRASRRQAIPLSERWNIRRRL